MHGPVIGAGERSRLIAAFNGGFKIRDAHGGWLSEGRTVVPLVRGAASVVTYADGFTDIGAWGVEVPDAHRRVVSVRQNLTLMIDRGLLLKTRPRSQRELDLWWGHAFREQPLISRSALAITRTGSLLWGAGTRITVAALAQALAAHGAVRALELDVNAPLVRGFLFPGVATVVAAGSVAARPVPLVIGQTQPASVPSRATPHCDFVRACPRDFFTLLLRSPSP
ncbi:MAG: hypothetical protein JWO12_2852 [Frankiales bacterium]|nr:hypothetical protein [Frankiales bacterium]